MNRVVRILICLPGALLLANAFGWVINPALAAERLAMPLLEGTARGSQIAAFGAFYLSSAFMSFVGAWTQRIGWLIGAAMLPGFAVAMRLIAYGSHDAPLTEQTILTEAITAVIFLGGAWFLKRERAREQRRAAT